MTKREWFSKLRTLVNRYLVSIEYEKPIYCLGCFEELRDFLKKMNVKSRIWVARGESKYLLRAIISLYDSVKHLTSKEVYGLSSKKVVAIRKVAEIIISETAIDREKCREMNRILRGAGFRIIPEPKIDVVPSK